MIKKVIFSALVAMLMWSTQMYAQSNKSFGIKVDANMSNFSVLDMDNLKSTMKVGGGIDGFLKIDYSNHFALQAELSFMNKKSELELDGVKSSFNYWGLDIPVYAIAQLTHTDGNIAYLGMGPVFDFGFSAKSGETNLYKDGAGSIEMQRYNVGAGVMLGYEFGFGMQINASYKYGFFNSLNEPIGDAFLHSQYASFGIGYRF